MIALGRYELFDVLASGGMASVHLGRLRGDDKFARIVAIKRLHPQFSRDPEFANMLRDEARLASRIRHPNVVAVIDVVADGGELSLIMDYVPGESLSRLVAMAPVPPAIAVSLMLGVLAGLHAAHEVSDANGQPLELVHRDVSPHNVLVGTDGLAHVIDFGIAKARGRSTMTREGDLKGKLAYMAPEQIRRERVTRAADIYAAAVTLWEMLTGRRTFDADDEAGLIVQVLSGVSEPPSRCGPAVSPELDAVIMRGLSREPTRRYPTARAMADALERALTPASHAEVAAWLETKAHDTLAARARAVKAAEHGQEHMLADPVSSADVAPTEITTSPREKSRLRITLVALGLALVSATVVAFAFTHPRAIIAAPTAMTTSPTALAPEAVDADAPSSLAVSTDVPHSTAEPAASASAGPAGTAAPHRSSPPPRIGHGRPPRPPNCDPPYTIENGHKVFIRACL